MLRYHELGVLSALPSHGRLYAEVDLFISKFFVSVIPTIIKNEV